MGFDVDIYLLRHGTSTSNEKQIVCGAADYPLSKAGKMQAAAVCEKLKRLHFDRVYCSPLTRARQTIAPLEYAGEVEFAPELIELDTGSHSHITTSELYEIDGRYRYQGLNPDLLYPEGESLNLMMERVVGWFKAAHSKWDPSEAILIVGHEGTVCAILHYIFNINMAHYPTFRIGNCDYVHLEINADGQARCRFVPL